MVNGVAVLGNVIAVAKGGQVLRRNDKLVVAEPPGGVYGALTFVNPTCSVLRVNHALLFHSPLSSSEIPGKIVIILCFCKNYC